jgi:adenine deaminase
LTLDGKVLEEMALPVGGLMCEETPEWVAQRLKAINAAAWDTLGVSRDYEPLMTLCFMPLLVIPDLKISDKGLFDVKEFRFIVPES